MKYQGVQNLLSNKEDVSSRCKDVECINNIDNNFSVLNNFINNSVRLYTSIF